jgi:hypothetical protein
MNESNLNVVPQKPIIYNNIKLFEMRDTAKCALTNRKLNTEFLIIKNKILGANSEGTTNIIHDYTYDERNGTNNYVGLLLKKIKDMFPDSKILDFKNSEIMFDNDNNTNIDNIYKTHYIDGGYSKYTYCFNIDWTIHSP